MVSRPGPIAGESCACLSRLLTVSAKCPRYEWPVRGPDRAALTAFSVAGRERRMGAFLRGHGLAPKAFGHPDSMAPRETRRELNQQRFRQANERLRDAVADATEESQHVPFLCECADDDCVATVDVALVEWEAIAAEHNHYLMHARHQHSEGEEVVGSLREYEIARKPG
jgi:hypothetical protein